MLPDSESVLENSTESLVMASRTGSATAWQELVRRHHRLVHATIHSFRLTGADAEDVVQTTWLRLVERLDTIQQPERLAAWLVTTAGRECLAVLKRRRREVPTEQTLEELPDLAPSPEDAAIAEDALRAIRAALAELSERRRSLLVALFLDAATDYAGVSARTGVPVGSIGPTRARALAELRSRLDRCGYRARAGHGMTTA